MHETQRNAEAFNLLDDVKGLQARICMLEAMVRELYRENTYRDLMSSDFAEICKRYDFDPAPPRNNPDDRLDVEAGLEVLHEYEAAHGRR